MKRLLPLAIVLVAVGVAALAVNLLLVDYASGPDDPVGNLSPRATLPEPGTTTTEGTTTGTTTTRGGTTTDDDRVETSPTTTDDGDGSGRGRGRNRGRGGSGSSDDD